MSERIAGSRITKMLEEAKKDIPKIVNGKEGKEEEEE